MTDRPDFEKLKTEYRTLTNSELEKIMQERKKGAERNARIFNWVAYPALLVGVGSQSIWDAVPSGLGLMGCNDLADNFPPMGVGEYLGCCAAATLTTLLAYIKTNSRQDEEYDVAKNILRAREEAGNLDVRPAGI
jgi:hypothetical protein